MASIDSAVRVREGEELDARKVGAYLRDTVPGLTGELVIEQFPSGYSNLTYLIKVGERELVLRRPPFGKKAKSAHDMGREYKMLSALRPVYPYCPEPLVYCEDAAVMDVPFYVMDRLKGIILRKDLPQGMTLSPDDAHALCGNLVDVMRKLHEVDYRAVGLADYGKPEGYVKRQVEGWSGRYRDARTPDAKDYEAIMQWLHDKMPPDSDRPCVIHNDYKFDNVVLDEKAPLNIIGVLDWEMATIGDPLMDLGSSLAYWVNRDDPPKAQLIRMLPTSVPGMMTREEQVAHYAALTGRKIECFDFYLCFGLFRLAVIAQQIYYRFYNGQTKDKRFAMLIHAVNILEELCADLVGRSDL